MVVTRSDICRERAKCVERRVVAHFNLAVHVFANLVHRHVTRTFNDDLNALLPGNFGEFAERIKFGELCHVVCICNGTRTESIAQRNANVVLRENVADFVEVRVEEVLLLVDHAPAGDDRTATAHDARRAFERKRNVLEQKTCVDRKVVDALFGLFDKRVAEYFP